MSKWNNVDAGPRQVKELARAMGALRSEGQSHDEITGVVGGQEFHSTRISMMGTVRAEVVALDDAIGEKYGYQVTRSTTRQITADYVSALAEARKSRPVEDNRRTATEEAERQAATAAREAGYESGRRAQEELLSQVVAKAPAGAKALIVAEYHVDDSDAMTDYFNTKTTRVVAIGFRTSSRENFRALRAAAGQFPEAAHIADDPDAEHRDNYSMGAGNYLSDHGSASSGTGWIVRSREFPCTHAGLTEDAVPEQSAKTTRAGSSKPLVQDPAPATTARRSTEVDAATLAVIASATVDGNAVRVTQRLDRAAYLSVNAALEALGGKWNRRARAHLFPGDAAAVIAALIEDGRVTTARDEGWFPTPPGIVAEILELAALQPGMEVLEPSAGNGSIAQAAAEAGTVVDVAELNGARAAALCTAGIYRTVTCGDFLAMPQVPVYDRVLMNPPFADKADIAHVRHAAGFLRPGGLLAAIMSAGASFRDDRATCEFRDLVARCGGEITPLPDDAFKASGTGVRTVLVTLPAQAVSSAA